VLGCLGHELQRCECFDLSVEELIVRRVENQGVISNLLKDKLLQRDWRAGDVLGEGFPGFDREGGYTDRIIDGKTGVLPVDEAGGQSGVDELFVQEELDDQAAKVLRHSLLAKPPSFLGFSPSSRAI
jgi:hypothetical protein